MEQSLAAQVRELQARLQKETEANQKREQELQEQLQDAKKLISELSTAFKTNWTPENKSTLRSIFEPLCDAYFQVTSLEAEREIKNAGSKFEFGSEIRLQSKARFFCEPNSPKFGDKFRPSSSSQKRNTNHSSSTLTSPKWVQVQPNNIKSWECSDFRKFLNESSNSFKVPGEDIKLIDLVNKTIIYGPTSDQIRGIPSEEITKESQIALILYTIMNPLTQILGGRTYSKYFPASLYMNCRSYVSFRDSTIVKPALFLPSLESDYLYEIFPRKRVRTSAYEYDDIDHLRELGELNSFSRVLCEIKRDVACPRVCLENEREIVKGFDLLSYYNMDLNKTEGLKFNQKYDVVSQTATYCLLGRFRYFFIFTGNHITFGKMMINSETVKESDLEVYLSKTFDCCEETDQGTGLSVWEMLLYFILASHENCVIESIPEALKSILKSKESCNNKKRKDNDKKKEEEEEEKSGDSQQGSGIKQISNIKQEEKNSNEEDNTCCKDEVCFLKSNFKLAPIAYADLFPKRFATPAVLSPSQQWSRYPQEGDAKVIGSGRIGKSFRLFLKGYDGTMYDSVVKVAFWAWTRGERGEEIKNELFQEYQAYLRLAELQGAVIPRLLWYGAITPGVADALITEYGGVVLTEAITLSSAEDLKQQARRALSLLHDHGVLHSDIRVENILFDQVLRKVTFIDFGFAVFKDEIKDAEEWQKLKVEEEEELDLLLNDIRLDS